MDENNPTLGAALFLLLEQQGVRPDLDGWPASEAEILALTGANQDEARAWRDRLLEVLPAFVEKWEQEPVAERIRIAVAGFMDCHPDAVRDVDGARIYSDDFRDFVVEMTDPGELGEGMSPEEIALATGVPLDLYEAWVRSRSR